VRGCRCLPRTARPTKYRCRAAAALTGLANIAPARPGPAQTSPPPRPSPTHSRVSPSPLHQRCVLFEPRWLSGIQSTLPERMEERVGAPARIDSQPCTTRLCAPSLVSPAPEPAAPRFSTLPSLAPRHLTTSHAQVRWPWMTRVFFLGLVALYLPRAAPLPTSSSGESSGPDRMSPLFASAQVWTLGGAQEDHSAKKIIPLQPSGVADVSVDTCNSDDGCNGECTCHSGTSCDKCCKCNHFNLFGGGCPQCTASCDCIWDCSDCTQNCNCGGCGGCESGCNCGGRCDSCTHDCNCGSCFICEHNCNCNSWIDNLDYVNDKCVSNCNIILDCPQCLHDCDCTNRGFGGCDKCTENCNCHGI